MPNDFRKPPTPRVLPFIGGIIGGVFATIFYAIISITISAMFGGTFNSALAWVVPVASLLLGIYGLIKLVRSARADTGSSKYSKMGIVAGVCLTFLLAGSCFAVLANAKF